MNASLAAVYSGVPGQTELRKISLPEPAAGEMVVRILGCTLCGSDLHSFEGRRQVPVPTILGHEIVGEIVSFGDHAPRQDMAGNGIATGDRITWSLVASCGHCFFCQRGLPQKCVKAVKYGHEPFRPGRELLGGLAEYCLIVPGTSIVRLPDALPLEVACSANCATSTAAAAIEAAGNFNESTVCVLGGGLLGLTVCAMARSEGAANIVCVEPQTERRARAQSFGATHAISPDELPDTAKSITAGRGVDAVFEVSGSAAAFRAAWPTARIGGTFVVVGAVFPTPPVELPLEQLVRRHLTLRGIHNYSPRHLLRAVEFLDKHGQTYPFATLVAQWHPLANVEQAFQAARDSNKIRVGVRAE
jgi:putative phosphonate catabolism associated alcohol dehydrogenase